MSLNDFRDQILSNPDEKRVEVDQRSLIDKILARYPSKFVIYRELMQNADDAESSSIKIEFETENNKVKRILFKNNGLAFRTEDWSRLKYIAQGNPDEQKIGAFGVGFYSLFSVCDNPFIYSNGQGMIFEWQEDQLFTRQGTLERTDDNWTTFLMDMREPIDLPNIEEFARFLANSLVFTESIQEVSVYYSDMLVIQLSKKMQCLRSIDVTSFYTFSPRMMFQLTSIDVRNVQLDLNISLVEYQTEKKSIRLRIASGDLNVIVDDRFSEEMKQIIKKKPPKNTSIQMIFTEFDENSSEDYEYPVFKDLLSYPEQGSIYIGFPTNQTTGCCSHLAARVIPTISRVSIDFANTTLAKYNNEMLCLAGTLYRILYEDEMDQIKRLYNEMIDVDVEDDENTGSIRESIEKRAAYALAYFTFHPSTPEAKVGEMAESQFLKQELSILSTNGVHPISDVRMPNPEMSGFMKTVPVFPKIILEQCEMFFKKAKNMIKELTLQDVLRELENRTLSEDEMAELLKWWISYGSKGNNVNPSDYSKFMQLACIGDRSQSLNKISYFLNPGIIPPGVDVPAEVLPHTISKKLKDQKLKNQVIKQLLGWSELSLVHWAKFIVNKPDLEAKPSFSEEVLKILAKSLNNTSQDNKEIIRGLFKNKKCIPTRSRMIIPNDAYFENVNIFPDLPTIQFQNSSPSLNNLMELLGVRKVVKLELIFDRLNSQDSQGICDHMQLIKYLASKLDELKDDEIEALRNKPIWPRGNLAGSQPDNNESKGTNPKSRFIASRLYTPLTTNREFRLPVIDWKGKWSRNSSEGKFLIMLGLQEYPTLEKILKLATPPTDSEIREKALKYFLDNFEKKYSEHYKPSAVNVAFLPCSDPNVYAKPLECFINPKCNIMKFKVIRQDLKFYVEKIGVLQQPNRSDLLEGLTNNIPRDENEAKEVLEYLATRQGDFLTSDFKKLADLEFIPIRDKIQPNKIIHTNPRNCYFEIESDLNDFFTRIDFGDRANKFLEYCGVKNKPSSMDFAELLVKSSRELWNAIKPEKYLDILRTIACDFSKISKQLIKQMKKAPILLAVKKKAGTKKLNYSLASAKEIYINDDTIYREVFNPLTAPEEDFLENDLYKKLGCKSLHGSVKETSNPEGIIGETRKSRQFQARIVERAILFYHNCPENKVKRNKEWVEKLKVFQTERIETNYKLGTILKTREVDTIILQDTLYITDKSGWLDISRQLVKNIYESDDSRDALCLNTLLTTEDLSDLEKIGYPVDRIMRQPPEPQHIIKKSDESYNNSSLNIKSPIENPILSTPHILFAGDSASLGARNLVSNSNLVELNNNVKTIKPVIIEGPTKNYSNINVTYSPTIINHQNNINIDESQMRYYVISGIYYSLRYSGREIHEIKLYDTEGSNILSQSYDVPSKKFVNMLEGLASVFRLSPKLINVFYNSNANSKIAFNSDGELFFNLKFYLELHEEKCRDKPTINAMTYWFLIFCHILERNEIPIHHELLSSAETHISDFLKLMKEREIRT